MNEHLSKHKVTSRKMFIEFIDLLREDFIRNPDSWENKSIIDFLEAMSRYTEDIQGYYDNTKQELNADNPTWQVFSDIMKGATMYE